ncbi:Na+/H+ antiporter subunit E [Thermogladius sp. 4427co]|uniref:Na+/H+ antiporter subunit E n=1 Tax=Thermogladius sp. 4427co TaxID=3450718 RepID=UPI003F7ADFC3
MRVARALPVIILSFITYIVFTGSISGYDLVTGLVASVAIGLLFSNITVEKPSKVFSLRRWYWALRYALRYFIVDETKCHIDVMKRILSPSMPVKPGIVKVPFNVETDFALTSIANSITNTPGTVVVEVDKSGKAFYVHWIDVATINPLEARKYISEVFEYYSKKVFD